MPSNKKLLQAAAGNAGESLYVEDVFSTYLYTGNGTSQTITNGIDLDGEGGLVWLKKRSATNNHYLFDTERGVKQYLSSNLTNASANFNQSLLAFNSDGFNLGFNVGDNGSTYASWSFRKAEKFFDVVTYTGNGTAGRTVAHNLGSVPGFIIVKKTSGSSQWPVYHGSRGIGKELFLNKTDAETAYGDLWEGVTSTNFTVSANNQVNFSGDTYVAYLFASDAGGFGDDENIIKCGSYTGNGSTDGPEIDLGFEAQWVMIKRTDASGNDWVMMDIMRGMPADSGGAYLRANLSNDEAATAYMQPTATGLKVRGTGSTQANANGATYIYIAIRRPMKTPESGTEVFTAVSASTSPYPITVTSGFPVDMVIMGDLPTTWGYNWSVSDRLRGGSNVLFTSSTAAENTGSNTTLDSNTGLTNGWVSGGTTGLFQMFKRATGFMDVVAYTGDGTSSRSLNHNLGVTPELMIIKQRSAARSWAVYSSATGTGKFLKLEDTAGVVTQSGIFDTAPTSSVFTVDSNTYVNISSGTYIAYLFATLAGVSKVGSYTGTGSDLNVDCGFSAGARFILIKRTDSTGDWYVYDSERGIVAGNDPYLLLNSTAAEVTNTDYVDPLNAGFTVTSSASSTVNVSSGTYIFLAIA
jgi:hypothetical protein